MLAGERYKLIGVLGQGGMSTVYIAEDRRLPGKQWAIKEIRAADLEGASLAQEADTLTRLSHPNLPHIVDFYTSEDGQFGYLVMERIVGQTLEERFIQNGRRLDLRNVIQIALQLCDALSYLHAVKPNPIIHRDLKPSNILIDNHERVILIDLGTARMFKPKQMQDTRQIGTLGFAAPEQLADEQTDPRTDLYSLGCILFYLLSGGKYSLQVEAWDEQLTKQAPPMVWDIVGKLLQNIRADRYPTAESVKEDLQHVLERMKLYEMQTQNKANGSNGLLKKRIIVFLSLYPGAGSTTMGLSVSAMLRRCGIQHAFMEVPGIEPVLEEWLDDGYGTYPGQENETNLLAYGLTEEDNRYSAVRNTVWLPIRSMEPSVEWNAETQLRLLYEIEASLILADASHQWDTCSVNQLIELADEIVVICGPNRMQMRTQVTRDRMERIIEWAEAGRPYTLVINGGDAAEGAMSDMRGIVDKKTVKLPYCPAWISQQWRHDPDASLRHTAFTLWNDKLESWLYPLLREWRFPILREVSRRSPRLFSSWRKKG